MRKVSGGKQGFACDSPAAAAPLPQGPHREASCLLPGATRSAAGGACPSAAQHLVDLLPPPAPPPARPPTCMKVSSPRQACPTSQPLSVLKGNWEGSCGAEQGRRGRSGRGPHEGGRASLPGSLELRLSRGSGWAQGRRPPGRARIAGRRPPLRLSCGYAATVEGVLSTPAGTVLGSFEGAWERTYDATKASLPASSQPAHPTCMTARSMPR